MCTLHGPEPALKMLERNDNVSVQFTGNGCYGFANHWIYAALEMVSMDTLH